MPADRRFARATSPSVARNPSLADAESKWLKARVFRAEKKKPRIRRQIERRFSGRNIQIHAVVTKNVKREKEKVGIRQPAATA